MSNIVEKVAKALYEAPYWNMGEEPKRAWRIKGLPWDRYADLELCEWERDDYRWMAQVAIDTLAYKEFEDENQFGVSG